jgi:hypothetical protein
MMADRSNFITEATGASQGEHKLTLVACAWRMFHAVEMFCDAIYLSGRVFDCLLRPICRNLSLLSRGACSIRRGLSLLSLQFSLFSL